ncbi:efflux RND transporter periplasmic adaptor subunit [Thermaurantiacus sp.]
MRARGLAATLVVGMALLLGACSEEPQAGKEREAPAPSGERLKLAPVTVPDIATVPAIVTTRDMAEARARIPGVLVDLRVREGDRVAAGETIATIVDSRLGEERGAASAQAAAAEAVATRARADLERVRFLHREGVYAQAKLDEAEAAARAAEAQAAAARSAAGAVGAVERQGDVRAPAAGQVLRADIPAGSAVMPGTVVALITAGPPVVRLDLHEGLGRKVVAGAEVRLLNPAGPPATGRVVKVYPGVDQGRVRADAEVPGLSPGLVGERMTAQVVLGERQALVVPDRFISRRFGLAFATLVAADGKAVAGIPVEVRAGPLPGTVEILSGLKAGDLLVAGGPSA